MILHRVNVAPRDAIPAARANARRFCYRVLQRNPMGCSPCAQCYCQASGLPPSALHTSMAIERNLSSEIGPDNA